MKKRKVLIMMFVFIIVSCIGCGDVANEEESEYVFVVTTEEQAKEIAHDAIWDDLSTSKMYAFCDVEKTKYLITDIEQGAFTWTVRGELDLYDENNELAYETTFACNISSETGEVRRTGIGMD